MNTMPITVSGVVKHRHGVSLSAAAIGFCRRFEYAAGCLSIVSGIAQIVEAISMRKLHR